VIGEVDHCGLGFHDERDGHQLGVHGVDEVDQAMRRVQPSPSQPEGPGDIARNDAA